MPDTERKPEDLWYRVEVRHYSVADEWGDHSYTSTEVHVTKYPFLRATPRGVWLGEAFGGSFFVRGDALRQRAVPTLELAYQDAIERKKRHVKGCAARLDRAKDDLHMLEQRQLRDAPFVQLIAQDLSLFVDAKRVVC